ncbi:oxidoreductase [Photobacterium jeanii]|uniref:Oxidoreductase n=1 Tax=Photobacterium jeanii TaxID=858640 RepID=A0A178K3H6_9GAMM|nr:FAD-dependent oxidoreductase [Photobacterium jeanii]OAN11647.1 oxidoreductase [Photobacterium jeanii]PST91169.1 FAD-dependent oxidoreductase [Photobacterium jeanii]
MTKNLIRSEQTPVRVGIVGGGVAGSTIALRLAEMGADAGIETFLFEEGKSLVNGPPICHLHAGGNLYREISDQQCLDLLQQSIDTLRVFPHTANIRPTVIAIPQHDNGDPKALLPRLELVQRAYKVLVDENPANKVLGEPEDYFKLYDQESLTLLAQQELPTAPQSLDDWMIPVAKQLDLSAFKYPLVLVQEYGLSVFRIAATADLALKALPSCQVFTQAKVHHIEQASDSHQWQIHYQIYDQDSQDWISQVQEVDYLVNACGYRTGTLDNLAQLPRERLVEFKSAYVTHWANCQGVWPEVIFHGERGTPLGMAQLTPYPDGYFQLHGMTEEITLFKNGLVSSRANNAQPELSAGFIKKLTQSWQAEEIELRSQRAINHMAKFVPAYQTATVGGKPLYGAQQIPGDDPSLRAADISFAGKHYARTEIVKASSAITAANTLVEQLQQLELIAEVSPLCASNKVDLETAFSVTRSFSFDEVEHRASDIALQRHYPAALAKRVRW